MCGMGTGVVAPGALPLTKRMRGGLRLPSEPEFPCGIRRGHFY